MLAWQLTLEENLTNFEPTPPPFTPYLFPKYIWLKVNVLNRESFPSKQLPVQSQLQKH